MADANLIALATRVELAVREFNSALSAARDAGLDVTVDSLEAHTFGDARPLPKFTAHVAMPVKPKVYECQHCEDGTKFISDSTAAGNCPKCGADCMPF